MNYPPGQDARAVRVLALAVVTLAVVQILASGYLPTDDALRHAGKVVSGKSWDEILVHRPGVVDFSPGWHVLLGVVHSVTGANAHTIVWLQIFSAFVLFSLGPILLMRRPEAWLAAMTLAAMMEQQMLMRVLMGRPLVLSMAMVVTMCVAWRRLDTEKMSRPAFAAAIAFVTAATWIHGSWYLWALPVAACVLARRVRLAKRLGAATLLGWVVGALLTGHPIAFLCQNLELALNIVGGGISGWVYEMQPFPFFPTLWLVVAGLIIARKVWAGVAAADVLRDPVLALAVLGWVLGMKSARFWMDWGTPALVAFIALEIEALWNAMTVQPRRLLVAGGIGLVCYMALSANVSERWKPRLEPAFVAMLAPARAPAMPDSGGILYSDDRRIFYEMLYLRPDAPWRYALGYAPELMPPDDYAVYADRQATLSIQSLEPWARKLRPQDRLVIRDPRGIPIWPWLEWQQIEGGFYSGRVRRTRPTP